MQLLVILVAVMISSSAIKIRFTQSHSKIQSIGMYGTPCPLANDTACFGGFARASATIRHNSAVGPDVYNVRMSLLDSLSKLIQFHPHRFGVNVEAWGQLGEHRPDFYSEDAFVLVSQPNERRSSVTEFFAKANEVQVPYVETTIMPPFGHVFDNNGLFERHTIVTLRPDFKVGFMVGQQKGASSAMEFGALEIGIPAAVSMLKEKGANMTVLVLSLLHELLPNSTVAQLGLKGVDLIVRPENLLWVKTSKTSSMYWVGNTPVVVRPSVEDSVMFVDMDLDKKARGERWVEHSFQDLAWTAGADIPAQWKDSKFLEDTQWMQQQLDLGVANNPIIGEITAPLPYGWNTAVNDDAPCQKSECPLAVLWTGAIYDMFSSADIVVMNSGALRGGIPKGPVRAGDLFDSYPFIDNMCEVQVRGLHLWHQLNYSTSGMYNRPAFAHFHGLKYKRNPTMDPAVTQIVDDVLILDRGTGNWLPLERGKLYTVLMSSFLCTGGDGYEWAPKYPGECCSPPKLHAREIHEVTSLFLTEHWPYTPFVDDRYSTSDSSKQVVMRHAEKLSCDINTYWHQASLSCIPCPAGQHQPEIGQLECVNRPAELLTQNKSTTNIVAIIIPIVATVLILIFVAFIAWYLLNQKRRLRRILASAPSGQVTVVFTDIQASTDLWEQYPESMEEGLKIHDDIVRKALFQHNGFEVKTIGDSFMLAFTSPQEAMQFACEVQLSLVFANWPRNLLEHEACKTVGGQGEFMLFNGLRVRMGFHTADLHPTIIKGKTGHIVDYLGNPVNTAARIEGLAEGGQVLMSKASFELLEEDAANWTIKCIGDHKLKGIKEPMTLYSALPKELGGRTFNRVQNLKCHRCFMEVSCPRCDLHLDVSHVRPRARAKRRGSYGASSIASSNAV